MAFSHLALEAVVRHEGQTLARCLIRRGRYIIGNDRQNEITAVTESVSAKHARLTVSSDEHFFLEDLGSANGTFVDGVAIDALTPLTLDSAVGLGDATLVFERGGLPASVFRHLPEGFLRASRYTVGQPVVEGRTSTIFETQDALLRRVVAMKVLRAETLADPAQVLAFIRETQIASQLSHAGVLPVYDFGLDRDIGLFATTRFIEGESLAELLAGMTSGDSGAPHASLYALLQIFLKVCNTAGFAHSRGVVHGALRPDAVIFGRFGEVFVDHWGFAKIGIPPGEEHPVVEAPDFSTTPPLSRCSAPEQVEGAEEIDARADVYALGAMLYRILTLRNFNTGESEEGIRQQTLAPPLAPVAALMGQQPPAHLPGGQWPERLALACARALSLAREDRFADAQELKNEVADWMESAVAGDGHARGWKQLAGLLGRR